MRKLLSPLLFMASVMVVTTKPSGATLQHQSLARQPEPESPAVVTPPDDALRDDLALVAEARGWTPEEATSDHAAAAVVGRVAEQVAELQPDAFVGTALSLRPGGAPSLYIKGQADAVVRDIVASAGSAIEIVDGQPFSFDELEDRKLEVHDALVSQGYRYVSTGFRVSESGLIRAGVTGEDGLSSEPSEILATLPHDIRTSVVVSVNALPIVTDEHAFGGNWVRDDGVDECTSGWSVEDVYGVTGVTTAGHCDGINEIDEPGAGYGT